MRHLGTSSKAVLRQCEQVFAQVRLKELRATYDVVEDMVADAVLSNVNNVPARYSERFESDAVLKDKANDFKLLLPNAKCGVVIGSADFFSPWTETLKIPKPAKGDLKNEIK